MGCGVIAAVLLVSHVVFLRHEQWVYVFETLKFGLIDFLDDTSEKKIKNKLSLTIQFAQVDAIITYPIFILSFESIKYIIPYAYNMLIFILY